MGYILCPDGTSVETDLLDVTLSFHQVVNDMKDDAYTDAYRVKMIEVITSIKEHGGFSKDIVAYLHTLASGNGVLADAAKSALEKISPNFMGVGS